MAKRKEANKEIREFQCELFSSVNMNCDRVIQEKARNCRWRDIKGFWLIVLSAATVTLCAADLALLFFLNKIYLF